MRINLEQKIGMRAIKTAIAVVIGLYLSMILNLNTPIFVTIATITAMKSSFSESFQDINRRIFTAIFGVILGSVLGMIPTPDILHPLVAGAGILIVIYILLVINMKDMILLSCIVFGASFYADQKLLYSINRIIGTCLGAGVSLLVNYLISAPKVYDDFIKNVRLTLKNSEIFMINLIMKGVYSINIFEKSYENTKKSFNLLLSEEKAPIHEDFNMDTAKEIVEIFEDMHLRFNLLHSVKDSIHLTAENKINFERHFNLEILVEGRLEGELNDVYNFHINTILNDIDKLRKLLGGSNANR